MTLLRRLALLLSALAAILATAAPLRSPENQVFQFAHSAISAPWPDGATRTATLYLWIPETCERIRGLVILATNVPEHMLVGHDAIRRTCRENNLALVWSVPTFWRFGKMATQPGAAPVDVRNVPGTDALQVAFLEQLLQGIAAKSGYDEIAHAPWLPIGESGHLLMVAGLTQERPQRTIAAICVKNPHPIREKSVPVLWTLGTAQEWGQSKADVREHWKNVGAYEDSMRGRAATGWPLSLVVEPGTGHFACTDEMAEYIGRYITAAARARLPEDATAPLRAIGSGTFASLPLPDRAARELRHDPPSAAIEAPWYFDEALARDARRFSEINWDAATQLLGFRAGSGVSVEPFAFNSVTRVVVTEREFELGAESLPKIPEGFVNAGQPLAQGQGAPIVEWICGPIAPLGGNRFRVALDRTWKTGAACYMIARHPGDTTTRRAVQPAHVTIEEIKSGLPNEIRFDALPDVPIGTQSLPLNAEASSGLPVEFFVVSGPAIVRAGRLEFTPLPPRTKFPVEVTVAAWQWGRAAEPKVKTAEIVRRTFLINAPRR